MPGINNRASEPRRRSRRQLRRHREVDSNEKSEQSEVEAVEVHNQIMSVIPVGGQVQNGDEEHDPEINGGDHSGELAGEEMRGGLGNGAVSQDRMQREKPLARAAHHINPGEDEGKRVDPDANWFAEYSGMPEEPDFTPREINLDRNVVRRINGTEFLMKLQDGLEKEFSSNQALPQRDLEVLLENRYREGNKAVHDYKDEVGR